VNRVNSTTVIPGRASSREPGNQFRVLLWIPGLRQQAHPGMTAQEDEVKSVRYTLVSLASPDWCP
jgi:hypothetical protein